MRQVSRRITGCADVADDLALRNDLTFAEGGCVPFEVRVVVDEAFTSVQGVHSDPAKGVASHAQHSSVIRGEYGSAACGQDIYGVMNAR